MRLGTNRSVNMKSLSAPAYEENALMLAEANIRSGNIDAGLAYVGRSKSATRFGRSSGPRDRADPGTGDEGVDHGEKGGADLPRSFIL